MSWVSSTASAYSPAKNNSKCQDTLKRVLFHTIPGEIWPHSKLGFQFLEYMTLSAFLISHFQIQTAAMHRLGFYTDTEFLLGISLCDSKERTGLFPYYGSTQSRLISEHSHTQCEHLLCIILMNFMWLCSRIHCAPRAALWLTGHGMQDWTAGPCTSSQCKTCLPEFG